MSTQQGTERLELPQGTLEERGWICAKGGVTLTPAVRGQITTETSMCGRLAAAIARVLDPEKEG